MKLKLGLLVLTCIIILPSCARYDDKEEQHPSWMKVEVQNKTVSFALVSGWDGSNNAFNYNGYYAGNVTLQVPDDWIVNLTLTNRDGTAPHNIIVTYPYSQADIPGYLASQAAVLPRAYTEDVYIDEQETMRFKTKEGRYWLFCGISGHGVNDMWINLDVSKSFLTPKIVTKL
ncbi:MAG: sulfocyanin-like copper-binding protein [Methylococcaceae bacterium]